MRRRRGTEAYRVAAENIHRGRRRARILRRLPVARALDMLGWPVARLARALGLLARESERLALTFAGAANGLPAGRGGGSGATAPSPQLAGADALAWNEFDSHKE